MIGILTEQINNALEMIITVCLFSELLTPRIRAVFSYFVWTAVFAATTLLTFTFRGVSVQRGPIVVLAIIICVFSLYKDKWFKKLFSLAQMFFITFIGELISWICYRYFSGSWTTVYNSVERQLCSALYMLIFSFLTPIAIAFNKRTNIRRFFWILGVQLLLIISQVVFLGTIYLGVANITETQLLILVLSAILPAMLVNLFFTNAIDTISKIALQKKELEFAYEKNKREYSYYLMAIENEKKLSMLRHDMSNTLQTALALVMQGESAKGADLIRQFELIHNSAKPIVYCDNAIINTILTIKSEEMQQQQIKYAFSVNDALESVPLTEMELSSVLTNLLDNAIDACLKVTNAERSVDMFIGKKQGYFIIRSENSCEDSAEDRKNILLTSKSDKSAHGYGIRIIKNIAHTHNGEFSFTINGNRANVIVTFKE